MQRIKYLLPLLLLIPGVSHADSIYSDCDYTPPNLLSPHATSISCSATTSIPQARDLYGVRVYGATAPFDVGVYDANNPSNAHECFTGVSQPGGQYNDIVFPSANHFNLGAYPTVTIYASTDNSCTGSTSGGQWFGDPTSASQVFFWSSSFSNDDNSITSLAVNSMTVTPPPLTTVPPGTITVEAIGNVKSSDFTAGKTKLHLSVTPNFIQPTDLCADVGCLFQNAGGFDKYIDLALSGGFDESTTSLLVASGTYAFSASIENPVTHFGLTGIFGFNFGVDTLASRKGTFAVGTSTSFQDILTGQFASISTVGATTTDAALKTCLPVPGFFSLTDCLSVLFYPNQGQLQSVFDTAKNGFLHAIPLGYVTRVVDIMNSEATSTLPILSYTFAANYPLPAFASTTYAFNPWPYFYQNGSLVKDELKSTGNNPKNVWEIMEPLVDFIVYFALLVAILNDVTHIHRNSQGMDGKNI